MATEKNFQAAIPPPPANARNSIWQVETTASSTDAVTGQPVFKSSCYQPDMVGDTGSGGADGLVPAPPAGSAAAGKFLKADGIWAVPIIDANLTKSAVGFGDDKGTAVIVSGANKKFPQVSFAGTITGWTVTADQPGSISVDVWKAASSVPPSAPTIPTSANKISASAPIVLPSAQSASSAAAGVSTWTGLTVSPWDVFGVNVTSATTITSYLIEIYITRS